MMRGQQLTAALVLLSTAACAEPAVIASGSYVEGLLWHEGRMYFTEMGADRVSVIEGKTVREFWRDTGCGPTSIAPFGPSGFLVTCHLGRAVVELSAAGKTGRRFREAANGVPLQDPNASSGDGRGGVYFTDSGAFDLRAPATGRVYHLSPRGVITEIHGGIRYANGISFDTATRTLYVSEHLARRVLALSIDAGNRVSAKRVLVDFAQHAATRDHAYPLAGPDGIALWPGLLAVAEYGEGRVHLFERNGRHLNTLKVAMPFVDTVAWDAAGNLYAGGSFQNTQPPFEGALVRFAPQEWRRPQ
jgi:gluconolactonase